MKLRTRDQISLISGILYIVTQYKDALDFYTDAFFAYEVYRAGREKSFKAMEKGIDPLEA